MGPRELHENGRELWSRVHADLVSSGVRNPVLVALDVRGGLGRALAVRLSGEAAVRRFIRERPAECAAAVLLLGLPCAEAKRVLREHLHGVADALSRPSRPGYAMVVVVATDEAVVASLRPEAVE